MSLPNNAAGAVVIDANILIAICSKEGTEAIARAALVDYTNQNWAFFAPGAILSEVLFVLCKKVQNGIIDAVTYQKGIEEWGSVTIFEKSYAKVAGWVILASSFFNM